MSLTYIDKAHPAPRSRSDPVGAFAAGAATSPAEVVEHRAERPVRLYTSAMAGCHFGLPIDIEGIGYATLGARFATTFALVESMALTLRASFAR